jgi:hypothetical protein
MGDGVMWGENFIESIQQVIQANPYVSYMANQERPCEKTQRVEPEEEKREEILLSREALEMEPIADEEADERPRDHEGERTKSDDELIEEIDAKVTVLLTRLLMNQDCALIVLENFNKARDMGVKNEVSADEGPQSRLSLRALVFLSREERLPGEFQQAFYMLLQEYRALCETRADDPWKPERSPISPE